MITFAYKVGGWVRPNAYVIIRRTDSLEKSKLTTEKDSTSFK